MFKKGTEMKSTMRLVLVTALVIGLVGVAQAFAADETPAPAKAPAPAPARDRGGMGGGQMRPGMGMGGMGMGIWGVLPQLNLTDEQKTKVEELRTASTEKMQSAGTAVMDAQRKVMELVQSGGSDADVKAAAADYGKAYGDQAVLMASSTRDVRAVLTAEQKTELDKLLKERASQMMQRRGGQRGGGAAGEAPRQAPPAKPKTDTGEQK
jgi:Spy/CpxP family protein refolding chaperone